MGVTIDRNGVYALVYFKTSSMALGGGRFGWGGVCVQTGFFFCARWFLFSSFL